jgi:hypothetical protein
LQKQIKEKKYEKTFAFWRERFALADPNFALYPAFAKSKYSSFASRY